MTNVLNSETLRQVQLVQLEILLEFDRICKENDLTYQLFSGTLLGAIRHQGFIPWDDDIDVAMARVDYDKFLSIYSNDTSNNYFLQNYETDPNFFRQFSRLRKNNTLYLQEGYKDIDMHHGIFIDIFPLDKVMVNSIAEKLRYNLLYNMARIKSIRVKGVSANNNMFNRLIGRVIQLSNIVIRKSTYNKIENKIIKMFNGRDTGYLNHLTNGTTKVRFNRFLITEEEFYDVIPWEFEGENLPILREYDEYLTRKYGDYVQLPPIEKQNPHHGIIKVALDISDN